MKAAYLILLESIRDRDNLMLNEFCDKNLADKIIGDLQEFPPVKIELLNEDSLKESKLEIVDAQHIWCPSIDRATNHARPPFKF